MTKFPFCALFRHAGEPQRLIPYDYSWNAEGKTFVLPRRELENVVRIQISPEPYKDNYSKRDKARTVVNYRKKGKQENPKDNVISHPNKGEWVSVPLFD
jgi:hypothetical protein